MMSNPEKQFPATCSDCQRPCFVPFQPHLDKPVYCKECLFKRRQSQRTKNFDWEPNDAVWSQPAKFQFSAR